MLRIVLIGSGYFAERILDIISTLNDCKYLCINAQENQWGEAKTALIGSGDFAEQVADLGRESEIEVVGMFDGNRPKGSLVAGIPVLGNDDDVEPMFKDGVFDAIFICIGYARFDLKQKLYECFVGKVPMATIIHPTAVINPSARIGQNVLISECAIISKDCIIEDNVSIMPAALLSHEAHIGKHCFIAGRTAMAGKVTIGERSFIGLNSSIRDHVTIGHDATVGMGSVVTKDVADFDTVFGNPAKSRNKTRNDMNNNMLNNLTLGGVNS